MYLHRFVNRLWYTQHPLSAFLAPLSWFYAGGMVMRRQAYRIGLLPVRKMTVPVIVIGNITVGGTGKTPLVAWLCLYLRDQGYRPGIISRGYGGSVGRRPQQVRPDSNPGLVGEEPVLLARHTGCPVAVSSKRAIAASELLEHTDCDILICDDGLQHHALGRDIEVVMIDGDRRFGNGRCLPAGPLREPRMRLNSVDMIVCSGRAGRNEYLMDYRYGDLISLADPGESIGLESLRGREVHAVAGIGNPERFFSHLRHFDIHVIKHEFPDHYRYASEDVTFNDGLPVIMTEKDAIKCEGLPGANSWYLPVTALPGDAFRHRLGVLLEELLNG